MSRILTFLLFFLLGISNNYSQKNTKEFYWGENGDKIYLSPDVKAEFRGGEKAWIEFFCKNFKYPNTCANIEGRIILQFIVRKDSTLSDFKVLQSLERYYDKEALRVAQMMPKWSPAKNGDSLVNSRILLPIKFITAK